MMSLPRYLYVAKRSPGVSLDPSIILLSKKLWNLNYFFQYCVIEESRASEAEKIDFSKNEAKKFWESKLNFWVKTDCKTVSFFEIDGTWR